MTYDIRIEPREYELIESKNKDFIVRYNNATLEEGGPSFEIGDVLCLKEYDSRKKKTERYTGREQLRTIKYIDTDNFGLLNGYVVLGLEQKTGH